MALTPGRRVGDFQVLGRVRRAEGRGDLFAARHAILGSPAAIRLVPRELTAEPATREWLLREARVFADFDHPAVARVTGCFEAEGSLVLVYDFLDGILLEDLLRRGPLAPSQAARVAWALGRALEAAHSFTWRLGETRAQGIHHGDLTSRSVIVGGGSRVKILDFAPLGSVRNPAADRQALGRLLATMLIGDASWSDEDCAQRLPALPVSLRSLLDSLIRPGPGGEVPGFGDFLPVLEDICLAYDEGGFVPRALLPLPEGMTSPVSVASNPARKRLFVGDGTSGRVARYTFDGALEDVQDDLSHAAAGLCWMTGYGLYAFAPGLTAASVVSHLGAVPLEIDGFVPAPGAGSDGRSVPAARLDRSRLLVADHEGCRLLILDATGRVCGTVGGRGEGEGRFLSVDGLAVTRDGFVVVDGVGKTLQRFEKSGAFVDARPAQDEGLVRPGGCDTDPLGNLYVTDTGSGKVVIVEPSGARVEFEELAVDGAVALSPSSVHVTEGGSLVAVLDPDGAVVLLFDNYFFLAASEAAGRCSVCGFHNPVGVGRCVVCQGLDRNFPLPEDEGGGGGDEELPDEGGGLAEDMVLKGWIEAGEGRRALEPLRRRLRESPDDDEAVALLGDAYAAVGETEPLAALELLRRADESDRAAVLLGAMFVGLGAPGLAARVADRLAMQGGSAERVGEIRARAEHPGAGIDRAEAVRFFLRLAGLAEVEGRSEDALLLYGHVVGIEPDDYGTRSSLGRLLLREFRFPEAREQYAWMLERNPYDVEALEILACLANRRRDFAEARTLLATFFEDPQIGDRLIAGHGKLRFAYGMALRELGDVDGSRRELARSKRLGFAPLSPGRIGTFFEHCKAGDHRKVVAEGAELCLEFELFRWPDGDIGRSILWKMAGAYEALGDPDRAVGCFRRFLERYPTHPAAVSASGAIADLARRVADGGRGRRNDR